MSSERKRSSGFVNSKTVDVCRQRTQATYGIRKRAYKWLTVKEFDSVHDALKS